MNFGQRLQEARELLGMKKSQFAKHVGMSPSSITRYENGDMDISVGAVHKIADNLKISITWLLGFDDNMYDVEIPYKKIPLIGQVKEFPIMSFGNFKDFEVVKSDHSANFCVKVSDDNMIRANIKTDDILFLKKQEDAENGEIVAILEGENILLRRYFKYGKQIILREEGKKIKETEVDTATIIGKAVLIISEVE